MLIKALLFLTDTCQITCVGAYVRGLQFVRCKVLDYSVIFVYNNRDNVDLNNLIFLMVAPSQRRLKTGSSISAGPDTCVYSIKYINIVTNTMMS